MNEYEKEQVDREFTEETIDPPDPEPIPQVETPSETAPQEPELTMETPQEPVLQEPELPTETPLEPVLQEPAMQVETPPVPLQPMAIPLEPSPLEPVFHPVPPEFIPIVPVPPRVRPPKKKRKKASLSLKLSIAAGITVLLIMAISSLAYLFTAYEIRFSSGESGFHITLYPREVEEERRVEETIPPEIRPLPPTEEEGDYELEETVPTPAVTLGTGFTLELLPRPEPNAYGINPQLSFQEIYQKCSVSVVLIEVELERVFGLGGTGSGTGIVLTEDGFIVTSAHVIEGARQISVVLYDGTRHIAATVGMDEITDIAVLQIDAAGLTPAMFGDSDLLQIGEDVAVIGNPLGQQGSMSNGIISALNRDIAHDGITMRMIQTNAAINQGNSGGPLINLYGQVVGITNMKFIGSAVEGMGFAIPTTTLAPVVNELIEHGRITGRASIGIVVQTIDTWEAIEEDMEPGVYVERVLEETDAFAKGLSVGDRIVYANDARIFTALDLRAEIQNFRAGDMMRLTIERDGQELVLNIQLMDADLLNF